MIKKIYGLISKTETLDDGTIKVFGYASSGSEDSDGEFISPEAMKEALPDYLKFGAVREMHRDIAAGTALEAKVLEDGRTWFGAHVVDPIAVLKVKTGTYKGFSIGGKVLERDNLNKNLIKKIKLVEVSLVDRPANPEAIFTMFKADTINENKKLDKNKKNIYNKRKNKTMEKENLEKGLGNVQWIAQLVSELDFLYQNLQAEKDIEGDDSQIPEDLKNIITSLSSILVQSAQEETSELESQENQEQQVEVVDVEDENDEDDDNQDDNIVEMSNKIKNLKKSGARNSQKDQQTLNQILALLKELGADESQEDDDKNNQEDNKEEKDDNKKSSKIDNLEKMNKEQSEFISELDKSIKKMIKEKNDLEKRISELEKEPNFEKRAHLTSLSKSDDYQEKKENDFIVKNSKGEIDEVATAIKKAQQNGKRII